MIGAAGTKWNAKATVDVRSAARAVGGFSAAQQGLYERGVSEIERRHGRVGAYTIRQVIGQERLRERREPADDVSAGSIVGPILLVLLYMFPTIVAIFRRSTRATSVVFLDVLLGWTIVGWIIALLLALSSEITQSALASTAHEPINIEDTAYINGPLIPIALNNVVSQSGEKFYWSTHAEALGEIHHREYVSGYGGASIRVMRGVYLRSGGSRGHSVDHETFGVVDAGQLVLSNVRLLFLTNNGTTHIGYKRIIAVDPFTDGFRVRADSGKPLVFRTGSQREAVVLRRLIAGDVADHRTDEVRLAEIRQRIARDRSQIEYQHAAGRMTEEEYSAAIGQLDQLAADADKASTAVSAPGTEPPQ
ncbi:MAG TPA: superinfection immunity protein [Candidatus Baltobacteraceae bacterium]|nr:superinfection immunity protein [Candidatus Baltobacteraceae bacterium]